MRRSWLRYVVPLVTFGVVSCGGMGDGRMPLDNDPGEWRSCKRVRTAKQRVEWDGVMRAQIKKGFEYSETGRLERVKYDDSSRYDGDPDAIDGKVDWAIDYRYDDEGRLALKKWETERNQYVEYWYNDAGRVVQKLRKRDLYWTVWYREYGSSGERLLEERYRRVSVDEGYPERDAPMKEFDEIRTFRYEEGRLAEKRVDRDGDEGRPDGKIDVRSTYEWEDGRKKRVIVDERPFALPDGGEVERVRTYQYGDEGRLQRVEIDGTYDDGEPVDGEVDWRNVYEYDDRGYLTKYEEKYRHDDGVFVAQQRKNHEYACPEE